MSNHNNDTPVAVIIGAANKIGFALAEECLNQGMHVVMADDAVADLCDKVEQLSANAKTMVLGTVCNVANPEQVKQLAKQTYHHFQHVNLLINNSGINGHLGPIWELTHEHIRKVLDVNLHGVIHCIQTFMPFLFRQTTPCHIVNMASLYGLCNASDMSAYAMSQHALVALSESLFFDLKKHGKPIDVSVICPSFLKDQLSQRSTPLFIDRFHQVINHITQRSFSAEELAKQIMKSIQEKTFYVFPDKEVSRACKMRHESMLEHKQPYNHRSRHPETVEERNHNHI